MLFSKQTLAALAIALLSVQNAAALAIDKRAPPDNLPGMPGYDGQYHSKSGEQWEYKNNPNAAEDLARAESAVGQAKDAGMIPKDDNVDLRKVEHTTGTVPFNAVTAANAKPAGDGPKQPVTTNHIEVESLGGPGGPPVITGKNQPYQNPNAGGSQVPKPYKKQGSQFR
ncbi:hypothetical protein BDZ85DRAFT_296741 [Elsinoe ampelina]|uniref:Uncharacterized protein n=1 Tax=Elsinoe ampelina TaxID=302913 RepID=A0A6A6GB85_9PEZI|nr:hypothetical protein BDZ85DRAFT_296741 [Elsinoe ampelina]